MGQDEDEPGGQAAAGGHPQAGPRRATFTPASAEANQQFFNNRAAPDSGFAGVPINAPPPVPSTVVTPPPGSVLPRAPQRMSLADDELLSTLDPQALREGGALEAIEVLQKQLAIREQEAREFQSWERSMKAIGTPEALDEVEEVRSTFTEVIQVISADMARDAREKRDALPKPATTLAPIPPEAIEPDTHSGPVQPSGTAPGTPRPSPGIPETSGIEPTPAGTRTGGPFRLFWLWFAANSSVLSLIFGGMLVTLGMSLRQAIVAALVGVALSFLPIGLGTLASKWNAQPTMVVSRATFGHTGNLVPATLALLTRLVWGGALLWLLATVTAQLLISAGAGGALSEMQLTVVAAGTGFLLALVTAFLGYRLLAGVQLVLSILSGALIILLIASSWHLVDVAAALTVGDGPWILVLTGAILVFSVVGLIWSTGAGDLARYQRPSTSGAASMLTASLGNALPPFALIVYGSLLAASDTRLTTALIDDPIATMTTVVPAWFLIPLVVAVGVGLLSGVILSTYSGGLAAQALGLPFRREAAVLVAGTLIGAVAVTFAVLAVDLTVIFRDLATTLAVPTAAWVGIFVAEVMIRNRRFDSRSLLSRGGLYGSVRWVNLGMLVAATIIGYGFTTASAAWLAWQGYFLGLVGLPTGSDLAAADPGVVIALVLGLATPLIAGVRSIRRQESTANSG